METQSNALPTKEHVLPFGLKITVVGSAAALTSELRQEFAGDAGEDERATVAANAFESFLLALASNGVDISAGPIVSALETAVQKVAESLD